MADDPREYWNERYATRGPLPGGPYAYLVDHADLYPTPGAALDVGGGSGRNAIWLADQGWDVTIVDISEVGLEQARAAATEADVRIHTVLHDVEADGLPPGEWSLIVCTLFLHRPLFRAWPRALVPGGVLVFAQPTRSNHEKCGKSTRGFWLEDGELPGLVEGLEILHIEEGWNETGRHEARMVARRSE